MEESLAPRSRLCAARMAQPATTAAGGSTVRFGAASVVFPVYGAFAVLTAFSIAKRGGADSKNPDPNGTHGTSYDSSCVPRGAQCTPIPNRLINRRICVSLRLFFQPTRASLG